MDLEHAAFGGEIQNLEFSIPLINLSEVKSKT